MRNKAVKIALGILAGIAVVSIIVTSIVTIFRSLRSVNDIIELQN